MYIYVAEYFDSMMADFLDWQRLRPSCGNCRDNNWYLFVAGFIATFAKRYMR